MTGLGLGGTDLAVQAIYGSQATVNAPYGLPRLGPAFGHFGVLSILVAVMPLVVFGLCGLCCAAPASASSSRLRASILSPLAASASTRRPCV